MLLLTELTPETKCSAYKHTHTHKMTQFFLVKEQGSKK